jgi:hypothetical protein
MHTEFERVPFKRLWDDNIKKELEIGHVLYSTG